MGVKSVYQISQNLCSYNFDLQSTAVKIIFSNKSKQAKFENVIAKKRFANDKIFHISIREVALVFSFLICFSQICQIHF